MAEPINKSITAPSVSGLGSAAVTIRAATAADAGTVATLVRELARYERLEHEVVLGYRIISEGPGGLL
jgi:hypothetical protein